MPIGALKRLERVSLKRKEAKKRMDRGHSFNRISCRLKEETEVDDRVLDVQDERPKWHF